MTELDFDELDKAVSSILGKAPLSSSEHNVVTAKETTSGDSTHKSAQTGVSSATKESSRVPTSQQFATKRTNGRFMDVVPPSKQPKPVARPVSRRGVIINPVSTTLQAAKIGTHTEKQTVDEMMADRLTDHLEEDVSDGVPQSDLVTANLSKQEASTTGVGLPDPLDFHGFTTAEDSPASTASKHQTTVQTEPRSVKHGVNERIATEIDTTATPIGTNKPISGMSDEEIHAALESPFLSDAKVEKRPLGAFSETPQDDSSDSESGNYTTDVKDSVEVDEVITEGAANEQNNEIGPDEEVNALSSVSVDSVEQENNDALIESTDTTDSIPRELHEELLSIESDQNDVTKLDSEGITVEKVASDEVPNGLSSSRIGTSSIPTQYKEQARDNDAGAGSAVFDTDTYHQPLKHPEKKKSGLLSTLLIFLLVVIGAGGGIAAYYFLQQ